MALRFVDGLQHYAIPSQIGTKYTAYNDSGSLSGITTMTGRRAGATALVFRTTSDYVTLTLDSQQTWIIGLAYQINGSESGALLQINDSAGNNQLCVAITSGNAIQLIRGSQYGTVLATSSQALALNTWYYIEIKMTIASSGGLFEARVNEQVWVTYSGNTQSSSNANANTFTIKGRTSHNAFHDVYICDGTGSRGNTYLGDCRVDTVMPSGAGNYAQFSVQGNANNWANVNETPLDNDTTYNYSATVGTLDSFACAALTAITGTIFGVQENLVARKDDAGARSLAGTTRVSSTDYVGATLPITTSYLDYRQIWDQNPNTSAAWTASQINASEFGYKVIS